MNNSEPVAGPGYESFLDVLQRFNKYEVPLTSDTSLIAIGVDSLDTISLLVDIEEQLGVVIPDEQLDASVFETVKSLWATVSQSQR